MYFCNGSQQIAKSVRNSGNIVNSCNGHNPTSSPMLERKNCRRQSYGSSCSPGMNKSDSSAPKDVSKGMRQQYKGSVSAERNIKIYTHSSTLKTSDSLYQSSVTKSSPILMKPGESSTLLSSPLHKVRNSALLYMLKANNSVGQ